MARSLSLLVALVSSSTALAYHTWPNLPLDLIESRRWDQLGFNSISFGRFVNPCLQSVKGGTRTNAADWIRTAYHDMATADVQAGTGGIDASIQFDEEQKRPENTGDTFNNTLQVFYDLQMPSRFTSLADVIALAAVFAIEQCNGPEIPFRAGRVDATKAGPAGVPEPHQTLEDHTAKFAKQGFTPTEMIQLIACGHTVGGVQGRFFPEITPNSPSGDNPDAHVNFDSSGANFDNKIATDYISGTTTNPLVVGKNITDRSDMRIFSSDKNVTMKALAASESFFRSTCATLFERMINTVPKGVQLTQVIEPLPVKPHGIGFIRLTNGNFIMKGQARFWNYKAVDKPQVRIAWAGSDGKACAGCLSDPMFSDYSFYTGRATGNRTSVWMELQSYITISTISANSTSFKFWYEVTVNGKKTIEDQGGAGFQLQTQFVISEQSCGYSEGWRAVIAVKKGVNPSRLWVESDKINGVRNVPGTAAVAIASIDRAASAKDATYDIWIANVTENTTGRQGMNLVATIGGKNVTDGILFTGNLLGNHACQT